MDDEADARDITTTHRRHHMDRLTKPQRQLLADLADGTVCFVRGYRVEGCPADATILSLARRGLLVRAPRLDRDASLQAPALRAYRLARR